MKKLKLLSFTGLIVALVAIMIILPACKEGTQEVVTETVTETVVETVEVEKEEAIVYGYDDYREAAVNKQEYPGKPGEGKKLAFANFTGAMAFTVSVQEGIVDQAKLAGFAEEDIFIADNQADAIIGLQNANIMLAKEPDVFVEFQLDGKVNAIVGQKFSEAGIPVIAIDVPVPGAPFVGVDNYGAAIKNGRWMSGAIIDKWGSIEEVDLILVCYQPQAGMTVQLRGDGVVDALIEEFGEEALRDKLIRVDAGFTTEEAEAGISQELAANPNAENICVALIGDLQAVGAVSALESAGILRENTIIVSNGLDETGQQLLRSGKIDANCAYFPEKYGEFIVPAASAVMQGQLIPAEIFVENLVVTAETLDQYYPE